jgi:hypothetical protein
MKRKNITLKGLVLGVALFLGASSAFATGNIRINPYLDTDFSIISVINPSESVVKMKIYDEAGNLYYSNKVSAEASAQKLFDFSYLEDGTYKIVLAGKENTIEKEFEVVDKKLVNISENVASEKTLFRADKDNLFVTYLSFNNTTFDITINDEFGNEVFNNSYDSEPTFSRKFNVEALPKGNYKVRLVSDNKEYDYAFSK